MSLTKEEKIKVLDYAIDLIESGIENYICYAIDEAMWSCNTNYSHNNSVETIEDIFPSLMIYKPIIRRTDTTAWFRVTPYYQRKRVRILKKVRKHIIKYT